jgi:polyphosphate kinase 2 (PPK2 family)
MLSTIDLTKTLTKEEYIRDLIRYQLQLRALAYQLYVQKRPLLIVYEGWDAGGKGGNIKRITEKLDPRGYEVYAIAAPQGDDKTHHYLWRFWRRLKPPDEKQILVFDRSWYGRVLVERLEGFCTEEEWKRAYREINQFERQLVDFGSVLVKFWIHISKEEQLRRFQGRQETPYKAWKLTDEDWRNRQKWDLYEEAINDMLLKTSTLTAPWTIVEGDCKWYARVKALRTLVEVLTEELNYRPPDLVAAADNGDEGDKGGEEKKEKKKKKKEEQGEADAATDSKPKKKNSKKKKRKKKKK